jgi:hypothetical protein
MTSPFTRIYPSTGDGIVTLDGGLNSKFPRSLIRDNESPDCFNVIFNNGGCETRGGSTKLNTAAIGSFTVDGLYTRRDNSASETMIAFAGGSAWDLQGTSFITIGSAQSVYTAGQRVGAAQYENHIFCGNAGVIPYKYNGTDFTRHGVYPPTSTHTAATNSNGTLTGDYQWKVTYVNSQSVESDVGPVNSTFTAASEDVAITSIPVAPQSFGVDARKIYRTENGGTDFKLLTTINDNSTTSYIDNSSDSELGAAAPTDKGVPPNYGIIEYTQNRLFCNDPANPNYVVYSDLAEPYTFGALSFIRLGDNATDIVKSIKAYNNGLIVTGERTMTFIYMPDTTPGNWIPVILKVPFGSSSPFGLLPFNDRLIFPATEGGKFAGIGTLVGSAVEPDATFLSVMTAGGELSSTKIADQMSDVQQAYIGNISAIAFDNRVYIAITKDTGETQNNYIYTLDYDNDNLSKVQKFSWAPWDGINASQFTVYNNLLYCGDSTATGFIRQLNTTTYNDDGTAINSYYWTRDYPGFKNDENFHKDFRFINLLVEKPGDWNMDVFARVDSDKGDGDKYTIDLDPGGSLWGTMRWGEDDWGGGSDEEDVKLFLGSLRGKRIQFKFTNQNTANQKFKVDWIKFAYNKKGYR